MIATLALRRRTQMEQRVLRLLRGVDRRPGSSCKARRRRRAGRPVPFTAEQIGLLADLRDLAGKAALHIQPADAPYVTFDELRLLTWLAVAQRGSLRLPDSGSPALTQAVLSCAAMLSAVGLRLPSSPLYGLGHRAPPRIINSSTAQT